MTVFSKKPALICGDAVQIDDGDWAGETGVVVRLELGHESVAVVQLDDGPMVEVPTRLLTKGSNIVKPPRGMHHD